GGTGIGIETTACAVRDPTNSRFVPRGQLSRCAPSVGGAAGQPPNVLLHRRSARDHRRTGPEGAAPADPGGRSSVVGVGHRSAAFDTVRPVACAGPYPALVGDGV